MSEQLNASTTREEESNFQFHIRLGSIDNCIEIPADGEWHSIIYYDGDITFDSIEVHNRALSEDEIRDAFSCSLISFTRSRIMRFNEIFLM